MRCALICLVAVVVVASGCGASGRRPTLSVSSSSSAEDQPLTIKATGFKRHQRVTLTLRSTDARGVVFSSHASYIADGAGSIDLARDAPLPNGSYTTAWAMGLLPSMTAHAASPFTYYSWGNNPRVFRLTATSAGRTLASTTFARRWGLTKVTERKLTVAKDGIYGVFYTPPGARHRPAVLSFGGSEGALSEHGGMFTGRLALHGIPTLYIGYFHGPGLPDKLVNIPLEYFHRALLWLDRQPQVDPQHISVVTGSYGSEAALLLGIHYPKLIDRIAATVPSSVVTCGIPGADRVTATSRYCLGTPWTFRGKPLSYTKLIDEPHPWDNPRAVIPVERIHASLLLACAKHDQVWSSCPYANAIAARRARQGEKTTVITYRRAGHFVGSFSLVYDPGSMASDLFTPWDERGREDLWLRLRRFLD